VERAVVEFLTPVLGGTQPSPYQCHCWRRGFCDLLRALALPETDGVYSFFPWACYLALHASHASLFVLRAQGQVTSIGASGPGDDHPCRLARAHAFSRGLIGAVLVLGRGHPSVGRERTPHSSLPPLPSQLLAAALDATRNVVRVDWENVWSRGVAALSLGFFEANRKVL